MFAVRTVHDQLRRLLSPAEREQLRLDGAPDVLAGVNALQCHQYAEREWQTAVAAYRRMVAEAEKRAASGLRQQFRLLDNSPRQLLKEFTR